MKTRQLQCKAHMGQSRNQIIPPPPIPPPTYSSVSLSKQSPTNVACSCPLWSVTGPPFFWG